MTPDDDGGPPEVSDDGQTAISCTNFAEFTHFVCKILSRLRRSIYKTDLIVLVIQQNRTQLKTTAVVQKIWHRRCLETMAPQVLRNYGTARWLYRTVRCHSF